MALTTKLEHFQSTDLGYVQATAEVVHDPIAGYDVTVFDIRVCDVDDVTMVRLTPDALQRLIVGLAELHGDIIDVVLPDRADTIEITRNGRTVTVDRSAPITEISDTLTLDLDVSVEEADELALRIAR